MTIFKFDVNFELPILTQALLYRPGPSEPEERAGEAAGGSVE